MDMFTTLDALLAELSITAPSAAEQSFLLRAAAAASAQIEGFTGRLLTYRPQSERLCKPPARAQGVIRLKHWPVVEVLSLVTEGGQALDLIKGSLSDRRYFSYADPLPDGVFLVTYTAGYALPSDTAALAAGAPPLPADLEQACIDLVKLRWHAKDRDPALRSENIFNMVSKSWSAQGGNTDPAQDVLNRLSGYVGVEYV